MKECGLPSKAENYKNKTIYLVLYKTQYLLTSETTKFGVQKNPIMFSNSVHCSFLVLKAFPRLIVCTLRNTQHHHHT